MEVGLSDRAPVTFGQSPGLYPGKKKKDFFPISSIIH